MVSVDDEKFCMQNVLSEKNSGSRYTSESGKMKRENGNVSTFEDDSFMDSINWSSISNRQFLLKEQVSVFSNETKPTSLEKHPELLTEAVSRSHTPPTPVLPIMRIKILPVHITIIQ